MGIDLTLVFQRFTNFLGHILAYDKGCSMRRLLILGLMVLGLTVGQAEAQIPAGYLATTGILAPFGGAFFTAFRGLKANMINGHYLDDVNSVIGFEATLKPRRGQASLITGWKAVPLREPGKASGAGQRTGWYWGTHFALGVVQTGYLESPGLDAPFVPIVIDESCSTIPASVNDAGWMVGSYTPCHEADRSFLRDPAGGISIVAGPWPDVQSFQVTDIADTMDVVGGTEFWGFLGLAVAEGQWEWVPILAPDAIWTFATGLNNKRQVVGTFARADGICRGFLYTHSASPTWQEFAINGAGCTILHDIDGAGRMVGVHDIEAGQWRGLLIERQ